MKVYAVVYLGLALLSLGARIGDGHAGRLFEACLRFLLVVPLLCHALGVL